MKNNNKKIELNDNEYVYIIHRTWRHKMQVVIFLRYINREKQFYS
jgi:hypothetical protein